MLGDDQVAIQAAQAGRWLGRRHDDSDLIQVSDNDVLPVLGAGQDAVRAWRAASQLGATLGDLGDETAPIVADDEGHGVARDHQCLTGDPLVTTDELQLTTSNGLHHIPIRGANVVEAALGTNDNALMGNLGSGLEYVR